MRSNNSFIAVSCVSPRSGCAAGVFSGRLRDAASKPAPDSRSRSSSGLLLSTAGSSRLEPSTATARRTGQRRAGSDSRRPVRESILHGLDAVATVARAYRQRHHVSPPRWTTHPDLRQLRFREALTTLATRAISAVKLNASFGERRRNLRHARGRPTRRSCGAADSAGTYPDVRRRDHPPLLAHGEPVDVTPPESNSRLHQSPSSSPPPGPRAAADDALVDLLGVGGQDGVVALAYLHSSDGREVRLDAAANVRQQAVCSIRRKLAVRRGDRLSAAGSGGWRGPGTAHDSYCWRRSITRSSTHSCRAARRSGPGPGASESAGSTSAGAPRTAASSASVARRTT